MSNNDQFDILNIRCVFLWFNIKASMQHVTLVYTIFQVCCIKCINTFVDVTKTTPGYYSENVFSFPSWTLMIQSTSDMSSKTICKTGARNKNYTFKTFHFWKKNSANCQISGSGGEAL